MILNGKIINHIHFVGIKGVAMTALAVVAKQLGCDITGSDTLDRFPTDEVLQSSKIIPLNGFLKSHITKSIDLVIYTGAHGGKSNPEVVAALEYDIHTLPQGKALGMFMSNKRQISVAGCHGKTTTSSLIASIFHHAHIDASYAIGSGNIKGLGLPGHAGTSDWFIAEADEYITDPFSDKTPRFLWQDPEILIVTNIDFDHPDAYSSVDDVCTAYQKLADKVPHNGFVIVSNEDERAKKLRTKGTLITVGVNSESTYQVRFGQKPMTAALYKGEILISSYSVQIPGRHIIMNAALAFVAGLIAHIPKSELVIGINEYLGAKRRFEKIAEKGDVLFFDDYAHHPKEIQTTIAAAKEFGRRLIVVFQPHTFSRTKALFFEFSRAFLNCDDVIITDIYASAREHENQDIHSLMLVNEISKYQKATYAKDKKDVIDYCNKVIKHQDIMLFMGAGDIYNWENEVVEGIII